MGDNAGQEESKDLPLAMTGEMKVAEEDSARGRSLHVDINSGQNRWLHANQWLQIQFISSLSK